MSDIQHERAVFAGEANNLPTIGDVLRSAREARGESLSDVAHALKLSRKQIEAMELERFDLLPGPAFVRGFVRNYARYLGIDSEPLIAGLRREAPTSAVRLAPVTNATGAMPQGGGERRVVKPAVVVVCAMAITLLLGWYFDWFKLDDGPISTPDAPLAGVAPQVVEPQPRAVERPQPAVASPVAPSDVEVPSTTEAPVAAETERDAAAVAEEQTPAPGVEDESRVGDVAGAEDELAKAQPEAAMQADTATPTESDRPGEPATQAETGTHGASDDRAIVSAAPDTPRVESAQGSAAAGQLVFRMEGESWIQVRDRAGVVVYTGIGAPGTARTVQGEPPFAVVVGNAGQVTLEYDGRPVDLSPHTRSGGVARMTVR